MDSRLGAFLTPEGYAGPRGMRALAREGSTVLEATRLARRVAQDRTVRRSTAYARRSAERGVHPVVLVPGFMAGDYTLRAMATHLRRLGYRTYRAGIGLNARCVQESGEALERRVEAIVERRGQKVVVVGHSLGGMMARGLAGRRPDLVAGIVTMGSPVLAPGAVHGALLLDLAMIVKLQNIGLGRFMSSECTSGACAELSWEQSKMSLPRNFPFTSVYSKRDGIVDWRACLDPLSTQVEVSTSHCGMAFDPVVFDVVTDALTRIEARSRKRRLAPLPQSEVG